jgi:glycosyltransferase involved in cell wall biosynthesis
MMLRVITATFGDSALLAKSVRSVQDLNFRPRHVLVCPAIRMLRLELEFPHCRIVEEKGPGLYTALNTGFHTEEPDDFFTWINDDDLLVTGGFERALLRLADDPTLDAIYGRVGLINGPGTPIGELPIARRPEDLPALLSSGIMPLAQPGTIFRWRVLKRIGTFDQGYRMAGDLDYFVRALQAGLRFGFHDEEVARFRLHTYQMSKDRITAAEEHARAIAKLPRLPSRGARWRFRWDNREVYWRRIRQHGFVNMNQLYGYG